MTRLFLTLAYRIALVTLAVTVCPLFWVPLALHSAIDIATMGDR